MTTWCVRCNKNADGRQVCTCFAMTSCQDPDTSYVYFPSSEEGNNTTTPDSVALSITGDIDLRAKASPADWQNGHFHYAKEDPTAPHETSWDFRLDDDGILHFEWEDPVNGTVEVDATEPVPFTSNDVGWVRVTLDVDNGAGGYDVTFYTSEDGLVWTQLGAVVTGGFVTSIADTAQPVVIGYFVFDNASTRTTKIYRVEIRDTIDGALVALFDANEAGATAGTQTPGSFFSSTGEEWTVNGPSWVWGSISCVEAEGNGTVSNPFQFHSTTIPNPRPFGFIQQTVQQSSFGASFIVPFNLQPYGIEGGMVTMLPTDKLVAPADGVYLVGAFAEISADATDVAEVSVLKNGAATAVVAVRVDIQGATVKRPNSLITLISMVAGDYIQLVLDGSATMNLLVDDTFPFKCRPILWASWLGTL